MVVPLWELAQEGNGHIRYCFWIRWKVGLRDMVRRMLLVGSMEVCVGMVMGGIDNVTSFLKGMGCSTNDACFAMTREWFFWRLQSDVAFAYRSCVLLKCE